jgi:hypothetical protein
LADRRGVARRAEAEGDQIMDVDHDQTAQLRQGEYRAGPDCNGIIG